MQLQITRTEDGFRLDGELDFSGVSFMDSSGLRALLEGAGQPTGCGPVVIVNPSAQVRRVLDISIPGGTPGLEVRGPGEEPPS